MPLKPLRASLLFLTLLTLPACEVLDLVSSVGTILRPLTEEQPSAASSARPAASVQQNSEAPAAPELALEVVRSSDPTPVSVDWNLARQPGTSLSVSSTLNDTYAKDRLLDGKLTTSWFAAEQDLPSRGRLPTIEVAFQEPVGILSVNLRADRERGAGLPIQELSLLITSAQGILLNETVAVPAGSEDINIVLKKPVDRATSLRLTVTRASGVAGLAEIEVLGRR
ncbi:MAG: hypothetical protein IGS03_11775 [Candidatus Sericytochromatia bacterium]|nr:hypothetical protein [Candidatus Sericytochromatia bacterium]